MCGLIIIDSCLSFYLEIVKAWSSPEKLLAGKIHFWMVSNFWLCRMDFKCLSILREKEKCMHVRRECSVGDGSMNFYL